MFGEWCEMLTQTRLVGGAGPAMTLWHADLDESSDVVVKAGLIQVSDLLTWSDVLEMADWYDMPTQTGLRSGSNPAEDSRSGDESLTSLAVYFRNWHMFREHMNNIAC